MYDIRSKALRDRIRHLKSKIEFYRQILSKLSEYDGRFIKSYIDQDNLEIRQLELEIKEYEKK